MVLSRTTGAGGTAPGAATITQALAEELPEVRTRRFAATEWRRDDEAYALFERALLALESMDENERGTQVRLV